jgi:hypothetical protein
LQLRGRLPSQLSWGLIWLLSSPLLEPAVEGLLSAFQRVPDKDGSAASGSPSYGSLRHPARALAASLLLPPYVFASWRLARVDGDASFLPPRARRRWGAWGGDRFKKSSSALCKVGTGTAAIESTLTALCKVGTGFDDVLTLLKVLLAVVINVAGERSEGAAFSTLAIALGLLLAAAASPPYARASLNHIVVGFLGALAWAALLGASTASARARLFLERAAARAEMGLANSSSSGGSSAAIPPLYSEGELRELRPFPVGLVFGALPVVVAAGVLASRLLHAPALRARRRQAQRLLARAVAPVADLLPCNRAPSRQRQVLVGHRRRSPGACACWRRCCSRRGRSQGTAAFAAHSAGRLRCFASALAAGLALACGALQRAAAGGYRRGCACASFAQCKWQQRQQRQPREEGCSGSQQGVRVDGWAEVFDPVSGHAYWLHAASGESAWEPPAEADGAGAEHTTGTASAAEAEADVSPRESPEVGWEFAGAGSGGGGGKAWTNPLHANSPLYSTPAAAVSAAAPADQGFEGWEQLADASGAPYYWHIASGHTQYEVPRDPMAL